MIEVIKMGTIIKQYSTPTNKPMLMLVIDSSVYKGKIENLDYYSNIILNNKIIRDKFSILKTTTIQPNTYRVYDLEIGTIFNQFSSSEPTSYTIREIIDDVIILTDKTIFIIDERSYHRERKLKKIGI